MKVRLIGVPSAWGAPETGVVETPERLRAAGLAGWLSEGGFEVEDAGDVPVPPGREEAPLEAPRHPADLPHRDQVAAVVAGVRKAVAEALEESALPLVLGGECAVAAGVVPALTADAGTATVAWLDAHGDINTPRTSASGLITGMPLALLLGHGDPALLAVGADAPRPSADSTWLLGGRDLDDGEVANIDAWGVHHLDTEEVRIRGPEEIVARVLGASELDLLPAEARAAAARERGSTPPAEDEPVAAADAPGGDREAGVGAAAAAPGSDRSRSPVYLHIDVDVIDPADAPGVNFVVPDGFRAEEVADLAGTFCVSGGVGAITIASANLTRDVDDRTLGSIRAILASIADALPLA